jgi:hypothetical protein
LLKLAHRPYPVCTAVGHAEAEAGLRAERDRYASAPARTAGHDLAWAAAVVAVHAPGGLFSLARRASAEREGGESRDRPHAVAQAVACASQKGLFDAREFGETAGAVVVPGQAMDAYAIP